MGQSGQTASEPAPAGGRSPRGRSFEGARGVAWLSGPFAFCSVTELLPWPESGAAAARACRAQFAARAGPQPGPTPSQPGQVPRAGADDRGRYQWAREGRRVAEGEAESSVSGQVRAGARERHPAPATGGAPGSGARRPSGTRGPGPVRSRAPRARDPRRAGSGQAGASGMVPSRDPRTRPAPRPGLSPASCWGDFDRLRLRPGLALARNSLFGKLAAAGLAGPPTPHLARHPGFPCLPTPSGLGGALLSAPCLPNGGGRARIFPATRAPPAEQVSTRSPEAQSSSSRSPRGTVPAAPPSAAGCGLGLPGGGWGGGCQWDLCRASSEPSRCLAPVARTGGLGGGVVHGGRVPGPVSISRGSQSVTRGAGGHPSSLLAYCRGKAPKTNFTGEVSTAAFPASLPRACPTFTGSFLEQSLTPQLASCSRGRAGALTRPSLPPPPSCLLGPWGLRWGWGGPKGKQLLPSLPASGDHHTPSLEA